MLSEAKITYDDAVRQVELEIQQAYSNLQQDRELYDSQSKNVDQAREALRLASARLGVGAGVQLDVLNAQVALTQAQSTRLSALFSLQCGSCGVRSRDRDRHDLSRRVRRPDDEAGHADEVHQDDGARRLAAKCTAAK